MGIYNSATACLKPFIVDMPAPLTRRNPQLSKHARHLYQTGRGLADGKTGALKIGDRWLKSKAIYAAAEMCRDVGMRAMRELVAFGLATMERERVERLIRGRRRVVLGAVHYFMHRQPIMRKGAETGPFLLQSISSAVEEIDSQDLPETPSSGQRDGGVCDSRFGSEKRDSCKSSSAPTIDDLKKSFLSKCPDGDPDGVIEAMLDVICYRAEKSGVRIQSENYFHTATQNFDLETPRSQDREEWQAVWMLRHRRYPPTFDKECAP